GERARLASGVGAAHGRLPPAPQGRAPHSESRDPLGRSPGSAATARGAILTPGPARIAAGLLTDEARPLTFRFDGRELRGLARDPLPSALLANGRRLLGRSFKYHRPRGVLTGGTGEPCALVDLLGESGREPNQPATTLALYQGLTAVSQNRWPSLALDV